MGHVSNPVLCLALIFRELLSRDCQPRQRRQRLRSGLFHDRCPMVFDSSLTDAKIGGDILAGMSSENQVHDLMLPYGKTRDVPCGVCLPGGSSAGVTPLFQGTRDTLGQFLGSNRFLDEIRRPRLHRLNRDGDVAIARDHDGRRQVTRAL